MKTNLVAWLDESNLVDIVLKMEGGKDTLIRIGREVTEGHDADLGTMSDWISSLKEGMDLIEPTGKSKSHPWENASNYKSPVIAESVRDFGDRYCTQILSKPKLVGGVIEGKKSEEKKAIEDRITNHMNYQINTEIKEWRKEQKSLGYQLAAQGTLFKKTWFDPAQGNNVSKVIAHPYFSVDNECSSMDDLERFTCIEYYYPNEIFEFTQSGSWVEFETPLKDNNNDKEKFKFYEQLCQYDLDDDGYEEPYIVTVHAETQKVVRIVARWSEEGVMVDHKDVTMSYAEMNTRLDSMRQSELQSRVEFVKFKDEAIKKAKSKAKLIKIKPIALITKYDFLNPANGKLLHYGFCQYMLSGIKAINKGANSLLDAGDLSNLQGGFLSKEHRKKKKGISTFSPGEWKTTNIGAQDLQNSMLGLPFKEPSQTLLSLTEGLKVEMKEQGSKINVEAMMSPNIPAASVLGILQEGNIPTSALMDGIVSSMSCEFRIMYDLNKRFTDPVVYKKVNDGEGDYESDYNADVIIKPTANAKFSSQQQTIQMATVQMDLVGLVKDIGANPIPIIKNYFDAIESDLTEAVFTNEVPKEEQKHLDAMLEEQKKVAQAQEKQAELLQIQTDLMTKEQNLNEREVTLKNDIDRGKLDAQLKKQDDEFALKLTELEVKSKKDLDAAVRSNQDLQLKYDTLNQSTSDKAKDRVVKQQ